MSLIVVWLMLGSLYLRDAPGKNNHPTGSLLYRWGAVKQRTIPCFRAIPSQQFLHRNHLLMSETLSTCS